MREIGESQVGGGILIAMLVAYALVFLYVFLIHQWNWKEKKRIERNEVGAFGPAVPDFLREQDKKASDLLMGFTPPEALKYLTDFILGVSAIIALFATIFSK